MDALTQLNTLCPVCDGPIGFEAFRLGERATCPHCWETIALGSVAPLPAEPTLITPGLYGGGNRTGGSGVYNFHPATGPRVRQYNALAGLTTSPATLGN